MKTNVNTQANQIKSKQKDTTQNKTKQPKRCVVLMFSCHVKLYASICLCCRRALTDKMLAIGSCAWVFPVTQANITIEQNHSQMLEIGDKSPPPPPNEN